MPIHYRDCFTNRLLLSIILPLMAMPLCADTDTNNNASPPVREAPPAGPAQQLIIHYKNDVTEKSLRSLSANLSAKAGVALVKKRALAIANRHVYTVAKPISEQQLQQVIKQLTADPRIESVEEDAIMQLDSAPSDPLYQDQWHYFETDGGANLPPAWDKATGQDITVAVLDTGILPHTDLNDNVLTAGYDFITDTFMANDGDGRDNDPLDPGDWVNAGECGEGKPAKISSWHGTHVAGTVAARANNNEGVAGVAYNANLLPVRVMGTCGGRQSDIADAIVWASGGDVDGVPKNNFPAKVINLSLGAARTCSSTYQTAIDKAIENGSTVVVSAGNKNADASTWSPANCNNVITVAASNRVGHRAGYSNYGDSVEITAPGGKGSKDLDDVLSTGNNGEYDAGDEAYTYQAGTSMAAPHVSGIAALLYETKPSATPADILDAIKTSARAMKEGACPKGCGAGIIDADKAIDTLAGGTGNPQGDTIVNTNLSADQDGWLDLELNIPTGAKFLKGTLSQGTGDADLYIRFNAAPEFDLYDCASGTQGNNETCTVDNPQAGKWFVSIYAYEAFSGVTLEVVWSK